MSKGKGWRAGGRLGTLLVLDGIIAMLGMGGLMGFVAADVQDYGAIPREFGVPAPRQGDTVVYRYQVHLKIDENRTLTSDVSLAFRWLSPSVILDAEGRPVSVNRVAAQQLPDPADEYAHTAITVYYTEVGSHRYVGSAHQYPDTLVRRTGPTGPGESTAATATDANILSLGDGATGFSPLACGLLNDLQGRSLDIHGRLRLIPSCSFAGLASGALGGADVYRPVERRIEGGKETIVFAREGPSPAVNLWFRRDLPYPVRLSFEEAASGSVSTVLLSRFERGTTELPRTASAPAAEAGPPLVWAPMGSQGPSEAGFEQPFPLSAAYGRAAGAPGALSDLLASSPQAFVEAANYAEWTTDDTASRKWWFSVTDGRRRLMVGVVQERDAAAPANPLLYTIRPESRYRYENNTNHDPGAALHMPLDGLPDPAQRPQNAPQVASLAAAWALRGEDASVKPNTWGFSYRVVGADRVGQLSVTVGRVLDTQRRDALPGLGTTHRVERDTLTADFPRADDGPSLRIIQIPSTPLAASLSALVEVDVESGFVPLAYAEAPTSWRVPHGPFAVATLVVAVLAVLGTWWRQGRGKRPAQTGGNKP